MMRMMFKTADPAYTEDYNKKTVVQLREMIKEKGLKEKNLTIKSEDHLFLLFLSNGTSTELRLWNAAYQIRFFLDRVALATILHFL